MIPMGPDSSCSFLLPVKRLLMLCILSLQLLKKVSDVLFKTIKRDFFAGKAPLSRSVKSSLLTFKNNIFLISQNG